MLQPQSFAGRKAWLLPLSWALVIFLLSSLPGDATPHFDFRFSDKVNHVLAYIPLGVFLLHALREAPGRFAYASPVWAQFFGVLYAISDEVHQYFVPGRVMDPGDMIADAFGVFLGLAGYLIWAAKRAGAQRADL